MTIKSAIERLDISAVQDYLKGKSIEEKKELLTQYGIDYDTLPRWQISP